MENMCKSCRSRQELSNAKIGVDTAEKEPPKVWRLFNPFLHSRPYAGVTRCRLSPPVLRGIVERPFFALALCRKRSPK